ncbi:MAG: hypothetical protein PHW04_04635 [Candidatus Wallbacteria bacterium]|nr:hypothetical protein [Candidatus Wallbacteria bacterium]
MNREIYSDQSESWIWEQAWKWRESLEWASEYVADTLGGIPKVRNLTIHPFEGGSLPFFPEGERKLYAMHLKSRNLWFVLSDEGKNLPREEGLELVEIMGKAWLASFSENMGTEIRGAYHKFQFKNSYQGVADQLLSETLRERRKFFFSHFSLQGLTFMALIPELWGLTAEIENPDQKNGRESQFEIPSMLNGIVAPGEFRISGSAELSSTWFSSSLAVVFQAPVSRLFGLGLFAVDEVQWYDRNLFYGLNPGIWFALDQMRRSCREGETIRVSVFGGANILIHPDEKYSSGFNNWQYFDKIKNCFKIELSFEEIGGNASSRVLVSPSENRIELTDSLGNRKNYAFPV